jgi:16S rRNA (cytosine1402-N4)-methyltransferase
MRRRGPVDVSGRGAVLPGTESEVGGIPLSGGRKEALVHVPVMVPEVMEALGLRSGGTYIDGTGGGGGHAEALVQGAGADGRVLVLDRDPDAVERLQRRLAGYGARCVVRHGNYADVADVVRALGWSPVDGVLLDLGISSFQVDEARRGFSFERPGPLDMRMDPGQGPTAAELVAAWSEAELADVIWRFGEERDSRRIARAIVRQRGEHPIETTGQLVDVVSRAKGGRRGRIHPATRTFQALRIVVNGELAHLEAGLEGALASVRVGGRIAVISFHSLEDRLVKTVWGRHVGRWVSLQEGGRRWEGDRPAARWVIRRPLRPGDDETAENPRARSAKLRAVERIE